MRLLRGRRRGGADVAPSPSLTVLHLPTYLPRVVVVIICLASIHTALVSSPSLTVLHLPTSMSSRLRPMKSSIEWLPECQFQSISLGGQRTREYTFSQLRDELSRSDSLKVKRKGGWVGGDRRPASTARPKNGGVPSTARPSHLGGRASGTDKKSNCDEKIRQVDL